MLNLVQIGLHKTITWIKIIIEREARMGKDIC
jgi:hypothetical protein